MNSRISYFESSDFRSKPALFSSLRHCLIAFITGFFIFAFKFFCSFSFLTLKSRFFWDSCFILYSFSKFTEESVLTLAFLSPIPLKIWAIDILGLGISFLLLDSLESWVKPKLMGFFA